MPHIIKEDTIQIHSQRLREQRVCPQLHWFKRRQKVHTHLGPNATTIHAQSGWVLTEIDLWAEMPSVP